MWRRINRSAGSSFIKRVECSLQLKQNERKRKIFKKWRRFLLVCFLSAVLKSWSFHGLCFCHHSILQSLISFLRLSLFFSLIKNSKNEHVEWRCFVLFFHLQWLWSSNLSWKAIKLPAFNEGKDLRRIKNCWLSLFLT